MYLLHMCGEVCCQNHMNPLTQNVKLLHEYSTDRAIVGNAAIETHSTLPFLLFLYSSGLTNVSEYQ